MRSTTTSGMASLKDVPMGCPDAIPGLGMLECELLNVGSHADTLSGEGS
jgi:hypothetical protein